MSPSKFIAITSERTVQKLLITALQHYVDQQFPPGSADCGQVAREELLNVVSALQMRLDAPEPARYSRRMRAMLKEGIRVYYDFLSRQDGNARSHECALLQDASKGTPVTEQDLLAARARDRAETSGPQGC
jgi:hypothetical protein